VIYHVWKYARYSRNLRFCSVCNNELRFNSVRKTDTMCNDTPEVECYEEKRNQIRLVKLHIHTSVDFIWKTIDVAVFVLKYVIYRYATDITGCGCGVGSGKSGRV